MGSDFQSFEESVSGGGDVVLRINSLEQEFKELALASAIQAKDTQAVRAHLEKLSRESRESLGSNKHYDFEELEHKFEAFSRETVRRVNEILSKLDHLSKRQGGEDEGEKRAWRQSIEENLEQLESQLHRSAESPMEGFVEDIQGWKVDFENQISHLKDVIHEVESLEREKTRMLQDQLEDQKEHVSQELSAIRASAGSGEGIDGALLSELKQEMGRLREEVREVAVQGGDGTSGLDQEEARRWFDSWVSEKGGELSLGEGGMDEARYGEIHGKIEVLEDRLNEAVAVMDSKGGRSSLGQGAVSKVDFSMVDLFSVMVQNEATELHLKAGQTPMAIVDGELCPVGDHILSSADCRYLISDIIGKEGIETFLEQKRYQFYQNEGRFLYKGFLYLQRGSWCCAIQLVDVVTQSLTTLGLKPDFVSLVKKGRVTLIGSNTKRGLRQLLGGIVQEFNQGFGQLIYVVSQKVHFGIDDSYSFVVHREVGFDVHSLKHAIDDIYQLSPNLVVVDGVTKTEELKALLRLSKERKLQIVIGYLGASIDHLLDDSHRLLEKEGGLSSSWMHDLGTIGFVSEKNEEFELSWWAWNYKFAKIPWKELRPRLSAILKTQKLEGMGGKSSVSSGNAVSLDLEDYSEEESSPVGTEGSKEASVGDAQRESPKESGKETGMRDDDALMNWL